MVYVCQFPKPCILLHYQAYSVIVASIRVPIRHEGGSKNSTVMGNT